MIFSESRTTIISATQTNMENLIFLADIKGFEDEYGVTEEGEIYSYKSQKFMNPSLNSAGYLRVALTKEGVNLSTLKIHRIIAETFIPNPNNYPCVEHIDKNKTNNKISNLRWATRQQVNAKKTPRSNTSSKYKGVSWMKSRAKVDTGKGKWVTNIWVNDEVLYVGSFEKEIDAAKAYNEAVDKHFGNSEFHYRNIL